MATNSVLKLGYDAALSALENQRDTLTNLRTRAGGLFAAAGVATTFAAAVGLFAVDPTKGRLLPLWTSVTLVVLVVVLAVLLLLVLLPADLHYALDPQAFVRQREQDENDVMQSVIIYVAGAIEENSTIIERRSALFRFAAATLGLQLLVLSVGLTGVGR